MRLVAWASNFSFTTIDSAEVDEMFLFFLEQMFKKYCPMFESKAMRLTAAYARLEVVGMDILF